MLAAGLAAVASVVGAQRASAAEAPTPQAVDANAEFLAYAPPPPVPAKVCVVDTGVDLTTDAAPAVIERHSVVRRDDRRRRRQRPGEARDPRRGRDREPAGRPRQRRHLAAGADRVGAGVLGEWGWDRCRRRYRRSRPVSRAGDARGEPSMSGLDEATEPELAWLENRIIALRTIRSVNVVAGAGNNGGAVGYPARFPLALAVGANDSAGELCAFSSRGESLDLTALGCGVEVSWPGGGIGQGSGTSYSTPLVSGVLAALRAYRPDLSAHDAERLVLENMRGRRLDARSLFRAAGLAGLTTTPPSLGAPPVAPDAASQPEALYLDTREPLAQLGVRAPQVRYARFRRGVLDVRLKSVPDFAAAVFQVDGRPYRRRSGHLRLRLRRVPVRVRAALVVPDVGRTRWTRVNVRARPLR